MCAYPGWNISPWKAQIHRVYNTRLYQINMEDEEHAYRDAHFQKKLDSLKVNMACLTSFLK